MGGNRDVRGVNVKHRTSISPSHKPTPPVVTDQSTTELYSTVDSGSSQHLARTDKDLVGVVPMSGAVETAQEGAELRITSGGIHPVLGPVYVCPELSGNLVSFHGLEAQGFVYRRHGTDPRLREWTWQGIAVPGLTFCVYSNNIGLLHEKGAAHVYPQEYPVG